MNYWCKKGHLNIDQAEFIKQLLDEHKPEYALETGFATGRSASTVLTNCPSLHKLISIDINFNYIAPEGKIYQKLLEKNFPHFSCIEKSSQKALNDTLFREEFPNGIDWFMVDGDHSYNGCLFDLNATVTHMTKNGIILVDDYNSGPPNGCPIPAVSKACDDFYQAHPFLEKTEWNKDGKGFCVFKIIS